MVVIVSLLGFTFRIHLFEGQFVDLCALCTKNLQVRVLIMGQALYVLELNVGPGHELFFCNSLSHASFSFIHCSGFMVPWLNTRCFLFAGLKEADTSLYHHFLELCSFMLISSGRRCYVQFSFRIAISVDFMDEYASTIMSSLLAGLNVHYYESNSSISTDIYFEKRQLGWHFLDLYYISRYLSHMKVLVVLVPTRRLRVLV